MKKRRCLCMVVVVIMVFVMYLNCAFVAYTATLEDLEGQINSTENKKNDIDNQLDNLNGQKQDAENELNDASQKLAQLEKEKQEKMSERDLLLMDLDFIYNSILELEETIQAAEVDYQESVRLFLERARTMYQYSKYSYLQLFVESEDILDFVNRSDKFTYMLEKDAALLDEIKQKKADLDYKKSLQQMAYADKEALLNEKQNIIDSIENSQTVAEELYQASRSALEELERQEEALLRKSKELESELKRLQEECEKLKYDDSSLMLWPAQKGTYISSYYGYREHPITGEYKMHTGIDIPAPGGSNILAAADGTVIKTEYDEDGYGNYLIVYHGDGISTLYAHSCKLIAKVGDTVKRGQVIALVGTTGSSTGNHLHFEVRIDGSHINPLNYLAY